METIETFRVTEGEDRREFTSKFDALRWAVRSEGMTELSLWHHTGERLQNGFAYKGENSLKMVESVTLYELADHPWLTLRPEVWIDLYSVVAEDLARADGVTLDTYTSAEGDQYYTDKGQDAFEEFVTQAEQLMTDSGLTKGEY
jgi:hypothetical protein